MTVERTVLVVEADGFAVLGALENPPPVIAKPVLEVDTDDQVRIAAANFGPLLITKKVLLLSCALIEKRSIVVARYPVYCSQR